jgi:lipid II:glycine glycyltransferase (peptidoglycan interpeptide bridge formation enzyme)
MAAAMLHETDRCEPPHSKRDYAEPGALAMVKYQGRFGFSADQGFDIERWTEVARSAPENPFCTSAYAAARQTLGDTPVLLYQSKDVRTHVPGFVRRGSISARLEIPSLREAPSSDFLDFLTRFCEAEGICETVLNTFASPTMRIARLPHEMERIERIEYAFDLRLNPTDWKLGSTHRRHVKNAEKNDIKVLRTTSAANVARHIELIGASMRRRQERGERVSVAQDNPEIVSLVQSGSGELFQALMGTEVLSSIFVLRSQKGGYDHSSGTSPAGMDIGASHFLIFSAAKLLQQEGCTVLNLGGTRPEETGLARFKSAFGTTTSEVEMVRACLCTSVRRMATRAARAFKQSIDRVLPHFRRSRS